MFQERLRIAEVAPLWMQVPPIQYGGAELMVSWLTEELTKQGHQVTLFASGDSITSSRLRPVCQVNLVDAMGAGTAYEYPVYAVSALSEAISQSASFDLIHSHVGPLGIPFSRLCPVPLVHTVHAGLDGPDEQWALQRYPEALIASISASQVATTPAQRRRNIATIYHGCDFSQYEFSPSGGSYLAFISRMGRHKNPCGAIQIARKTGIPIILAGQPQDDAETEYFEAEVKPLIDGRFVRYLGPISHQEKIHLLKDAIALIFPIRWEEHFGIAMIEAMACGTPVVANRRGSVPEVVDQGVTGFYSADESELPDLVLRASSLDRRRLYEQAKRRFSHIQMVENYLHLYQSAILASVQASPLAARSV